MQTAYFLPHLHANDKCLILLKYSVIILPLLSNQSAISLLLSIAITGYTSNSKLTPTKVAPHNFFKDLKKNAMPMVLITEWTTVTIHKELNELI